MTGPCLCGDPYCPSCGDPGLANWESAHENLCDRIVEENLAVEEMDIYHATGMAAVTAHREAMGKLREIERKNEELERDMLAAERGAIT